MPKISFDQSNSEEKVFSFTIETLKEDLVVFKNVSVSENLTTGPDDIIHLPQKWSFMWLPKCNQALLMNLGNEKMGFISPPSHNFSGEMKNFIRLSASGRKLATVTENDRLLMSHNPIYRKCCFHKLPLPACLWFVQKQVQNLRILPLFLPIMFNVRTSVFGKWKIKNRKTCLMC